MNEKEYIIPTEEQEKEIIKEYLTGSIGQRKLASKYGFSFKYLMKIFEKYDTNGTKTEKINKYSRIFSLEEELEIIKEYQEGKISKNQIIKKHNTSWRIMEKILKKHHIQKRNKSFYQYPENYRNLTQEHVREIINTYNNDINLTAVDVANKFNVSKSVVRKILNKNNIKMRKYTKGAKNPLKGDKNPNWNGGRKLKDGYVEILNPDKNKFDNSKYIKEHRYIMEKYLDKKLETNDHVHHINGIKTDNRIENLVIKKSSDHYGNVDCPRCNLHFRIR